MRLRILSLVLALAITAALLIGCGGSGGGTLVTTTSRVLAGFVYAKGNALGAGPEVVITTSATPPTGYFPPSSGTVTLSVADGKLTRSPDAAAFNMAVSNAIVVTAVAAPSSSVGVSGANIMLNGASKSLVGYSVNLGPISQTGTVETMPSTDAPLYTPGAPITLKYTINGNAPVTPKELFIAGATDAFGPRNLALIGLDSNGVINPAATFTIVNGAVTPSVLLTGSGASYTLTPGSAALSSPEADNTFTITLVGGNGTSTLDTNFSYGAITNVTVTPSATSLLWKTAGPVNTITVNAVVTNQYAAAIFGKTVTFTDPGKVAANVWIATQGTAFTSASGVTDTAGTVANTLSAPTSTAGPAANTTPKGANTLTATCNAVVGTSVVKVIRPLSTVALAGPSRVDIGTTTPLTGSGAYTISNGIDVDGASVPLTDYPATTFTYTVTNAAAGGVFGNTGDTGAKTASIAAIMAGVGNENRVVAGNTAGSYGLQVTGGVLVPSNIITTQVYGVPSKIFLSPDTVTPSLPGAQGNYSGPTGTIFNSSFQFMDSAGHLIPNGEVAFTSTFTIDGITGGNITSGGSSVNTFTLTIGGFDGLVHLQANSGTWTAPSGGTFPYNISKDIGHDKTP